MPMARERSALRSLSLIPGTPRVFTNATASSSVPNSLSTTAFAPPPLPPPPPPSPSEATTSGAVVGDVAGVGSEALTGPAKPPRALAALAAATVVRCSYQDTAYVRCVRAPKSCKIDVHAQAKGEVYLNPPTALRPISSSVPHGCTICASYLLVVERLLLLLLLAFLLRRRYHCVAPTYTTNRTSEVGTAAAATCSVVAVVML